MIQEEIQEGFFEKYFITPFFRRFRDFSGKQRIGSVKYTLFAWLLTTLGIIGLLLGLVGLLGPEVGFVCLWIFGALWMIWSVVGFAALAGRIAKSGDSGERTKKPVWLLIDRLLAGVCVMFFILGILMTVTTLNSGEINVHRRGNGEPVSKGMIEGERVEEVPIFTYQDETPAAPSADEMNDLVEADTVSLEESFDPTIPAATAETDTISMEY